MIASDILTFFKTSERKKNDATNKTRENILKIIANPPKEYLDDAEFGNYWRLVSTAWTDALKKVAEETGITAYTSTKINMRGGRKYNYDADVMYYNESNIVATQKIEFKNGSSKIENSPQFLSLQAKFDIFTETYDTFWYDNYLDKYIACDSEITKPKPSREAYLKHVTSTKYSITPFFAQLKDRESFFKEEKNEVVNTSITDYLTKHGPSINIASFSDKVKTTQSDKIYLMWCNGQFCLDKLSEEEMTGMTFSSIKNGNVLELKAGNTTYGLLLRWRNHKGILNPAWQISLAR
jgi:hypothetical protein